MNNEYIDKHNKAIRADERAKVIKDLETLGALAVAMAKKLVALGGIKAGMGIAFVKESSTATPTNQGRRKRSPTVASEAEIDKVWQVIADAQPGVRLTVKQINQVAKVGQTTASKACAVLHTRGQVVKVGNTYQLMDRPQEHLENGEAPAQENSEINA